MLACELMAFLEDVVEARDIAAVLAYAYDNNEVPPKECLEKGRKWHRSKMKIYVTKEANDPKKLAAVRWAGCAAE